MENFYSIKILIKAGTREEVEAALAELDNNLPVFAFVASRQDPDGKFVAEGTLEVSWQQVAKFKKILAQEQQ